MDHLFEEALPSIDNPFVIEQSIPVPARARTTPALEAAIAAMKPGDSMKIPTTLLAVARGIARRGGFMLTARALSKTEFRVWYVGASA